MHAEEDAGELFGTETMAELCARQGRLEEARGIYRRLCARGADDARLAGWTARLRALEARALASAPESSPAARAAIAPPAPSSTSAAPARPALFAAARAAHTLPLVVRTPVRAGQIVYAEANDLIVLAPVNPGAQLLADGNIHVYAPLRGRAVAGVSGAREARIFCQRLDAELVGIAAAHLTAEDIPVAYRGRAAQITLEGSGCIVTLL